MAETARAVLINKHLGGLTMNNLQYAMFEAMQCNMCLDTEKASTRRLKYLARQRARDAQLRAYLDLIAVTVRELKQNRTFYYD
jgi:hypothetical protein